MNVSTVISGARTWASSLGLRAWLIAAAASAVIGVVVTEEARIASWRHQAQTQALEAANATARADTLRAVEHLSASDSGALHLGDSIRVLTQLVVQAQQQRDAIDRALGDERVATLQLSAHVTALHDTIHSLSAVIVDSADVRRASFDQRQTPFTIHATASLPAMGPGFLAASIALDTAHVTVRLGCLAAGAAGIRAASLTLETPTWLALSAPSVNQSSDVCNSSSEGVVSSSVSRWRPHVLIGPGLEWQFGPRRLSAGVNLTFGWLLW